MCLPCLIQFARSNSSYESREIYKMKTSCPELDFNPVHSAYEANAQTIALWDKCIIYIDYWVFLAVDAVK